VLYLVEDRKFRALHGYVCGLGYSGVHGNAERWWAVMWLHDIGEAYGFPHGPLAGIPVRMTLADACRVLRALGYSEGAR
jgi:hypothetical protein